MTVSIRRAQPRDAARVRTFIAELAAYERLSDQVCVTEAEVTAALFGPAPRVFCELAELDGEAVGFALWFYNFSTFLGRSGLYLEDLYVRPAARGRGAGLALLRVLARRCADEGLGRMEWAVLAWNAPAVAFYDALGSVSLDDWRLRRLTGEALARLAGAPQSTSGG